MYQNILLPIDGSEPSFRAVDGVISLVKGYPEAKVTVLHVAVLPYYYYSEAALALTPALEEIKESATALLKKVSEQLQAVNIQHQLVLEQGSPVKVICENVENNQYDLVVLGSRGVGAFSEFVLGSVSHGVLHHVRVPVLIVR